jgi:hypothetical protein
VLFNYGSFDPFAAVDLGSWIDISEKASIPSDVEEGKVDLGSRFKSKCDPFFA